MNRKRIFRKGLTWNTVCHILRTSPESLDRDRITHRKALHMTQDANYNQSDPNPTPHQNAFGYGHCPECGILLAGPNHAEDHLHNEHGYYRTGLSETVRERIFPDARLALDYHADISARTFHAEPIPTDPNAPRQLTLGEATEAVHSFLAIDWADMSKAVPEAIEYLQRNFLAAPTVPVTAEPFDPRYPGEHADDFDSDTYEPFNFNR